MLNLVSQRDRQLEVLPNRRVRWPSLLNAPRELPGLDCPESPSRAESETLLIGRDFGIVTDIETGPNGNLFVVSLSSGAIYEVFRR